MPNVISVNPKRIDPIVVGLTYHSYFSTENPMEDAPPENAPQYAEIVEFSQWESEPTTKESWLSDEAIFKILTEKWHRERGASSSITEIILCPSYQSIIAMGDRVIPLILSQLEAEGNEPDHWFWALQVLTGVNPVSEEIEGNLPAMSEVWRETARSKGYIW
ncbi:MAG: hypothetical protein P4N24_22490 [Acidobacteriota bacterium]|nr:hypothetical protein [Acidobacteriota bacterium]